MNTSGAEKPTKRARRVLKDLQFIKENYVAYCIGHNAEEWRKVTDLFANVENFIVEISAGRRVLEAELAEKIKSEIEES